MSIEGMTVRSKRKDYGRTEMTSKENSRSLLTSNKAEKCLYTGSSDR